MPPRSLFAVLLAACALLAGGASAQAATPSPPGVCWLLDSPHAGYVSDGGLSLLRHACRPQARAPLAAGQPGTTAGEARVARPNSHRYGQDIPVSNPALDTPPNTTQNEVTVAACGHTLLAAWNDSGGPTLSGFGRSTDGGFTWTDLGNIPGFTGTDPILIADADCNFYYSALTFVDGCEAIGVSRSNDGGSTWSTPVSASPGTNCADFQDKETIAVDTTDGPRRGTVYACWDDRQASRIRVLFSRSLDGGRTFSSPRELQTFPFGFATGCQVRVAPNGDVWAAWTKGDDLNLYTIRSQDAGMTFGPARRVTATIVAGDFKLCGGSSGEVRPTLNGDIRAFNWPTFAINPVTGSLHLAWNDGRRPDVDVLYVRSNSGDTWSSPSQLNDDDTPTDQFQPAMDFTRQGLLRAAWYDRRNDPQDNLRLDVYSATSADDGLSFAADERITDVSFGLPQIDPNFDPRMSPCYWGDYIGVTGGSGVHYMAWGDDRNLVAGRPDPDVFFERRSTDRLGDVDCDGDTDAADIRKLLRHLEGLGAAPVCLATRGDTDCNGVINARDGVVILAFLGATPPLPQQQPCQAVGV